MVLAIANYRGILNPLEHKPGRKTWKKWGKNGQKPGKNREKSGENYKVHEC